MAIVPLGTANLTARALGVPARPDRAVEAGFGGRDRTIDLARVEGAGGTWFAAMAGIGLDAAVVAAAGERLKRRFGWVAYAAAGMRKLTTPPHEFTVRLDDAEPLRRRARCVVVANAGLLPGGFTLLPRARLDDGLLDVGILAPSGAWDWIRLAGRVLARDQRPDRALQRLQARASGSARMPSCHGRSTARSSRPGGRSASACARDPDRSAAGIMDRFACR